MSERVVGVLVAGRAVEVAGPAAELVALLAATPLSARTVALLRAVVLEEERLALVDTGALTVDLGGKQIRLHLQQSRPRVEVLP